MYFGTITFTHLYKTQCITFQSRFDIIRTSIKVVMDVPSENVSEGNQTINQNILSIKNSLVDIHVELADIKKVLKNQQPKTISVSCFDSKESFLKFNTEIESDEQKKENFMNVLKNIFTNNQSEIKSSIAVYYKLVLRACFDKKLVHELTWNKYKGKLAIANTRIFQAIQHSGSEVDNLSTEFDRQNALHKEFSKYKDSCRVRRGMFLITRKIFFSFSYENNNKHFQMKLQFEIVKISMSLKAI